MSELDATDEVVPQESVNDLPSRDSSSQQAALSSNTITLDELMSMTANSNGGEGWESDARSLMTDDTDDESADEETLNKDRKEFMRAIRSMHGKPQAAGEDSADVPPHILSIESESKTSKVPAKSGPKTSEEPITELKKAEPQLGRMWASEGDVMEEHEREVRTSLAACVCGRKLRPCNSTYSPHPILRCPSYCIYPGTGKICSRYSPGSHKEKRPCAG